MPRIPQREKLRSGWVYVWLAAEVQPQILSALFLAGFVFLLLEGFFIFTTVAVVASNGILSGIFTIIFLSIILTIPITGTTFALIALPALRVPHWEFYEGGHRESWVHPAILKNAPPEYIRTVGKARYYITTVWSGLDGKPRPMPSSRELPVISAIEVTGAMDTRQLLADASDPSTHSFMAERFNQVMAGLTVIAAFILMLVIYSDQQTQKLAGN